MNTGLRILYVVDSLGLGGANQTTVAVACEMKKRGHHVMLASGPGPLQARLDEAGVQHLPVATDVRHPNREIRQALIEAIRRERIDLVCPNGFACTVEALPAALKCRVPLFPTYGGLFTPQFSHPWLPRVNVFSLEFAAEMSRRYGWRNEIFRNLIARIDGERFHPSVDRIEQRRAHAIPDNSPLLVMVCRQDDTKLQGLLVLLRAAGELRAAVPSLRILLLGDGDRRQTAVQEVRSVNDRAGEEFVLAPGSTMRTPEAFSAADIVVANGARSALEGMACGRPVVSVGPNGFCGVFSSRTIEGFRRFNFDKGRLSGNPFGESEHLVAALVRILKEEPLSVELSEFSAEYARRHLVLQSAAPEYERTYREVITDPWPVGGDSRRARWRWMSALAGYYAFRLGRRWSRGKAEPVAEYDRLLAPPAGLDPEWHIGI